MAMRAQRSTVIDPMYIEDADVMKGLEIIMGGPEGVQIAKSTEKNSVEKVQQQT
jgi:hypothetical protein